MLGILGATGTVGYQAMKVLQQLDIRKMKCGVHNIQKVTKEIREEFPEAIWQEIDIASKQALEEFVKDTKVLLNCVGPSFFTSKQVAEVILERGGRLIDVGFCNDFLKKQPQGEETIVYAAGSMPGLSRLLCKKLFKEFDEVKNVTFVYGALDKMGYGGAWDYLEGITKENESATPAYVKGQRVPGKAKRRSQWKLPFYPREVTLSPYADGETDKIIADAGNADGVFYVSIDGKYLLQEMNRIKELYREKPREAVDNLIRACQLEMCDKQSYLKFLIEGKGTKNGKAETKTLYMSGNSSTNLTAAAVAVTAAAVYRKEVPCGIYTLGDLMQEEKILDAVKKGCPGTILEIYDGAMETLCSVVEGEI